MAEAAQARLTLRKAFAEPAALTLLCFGFASGLPFLLVGGTLAAWLKDSAVSIEDIGLLSLVGLAYALKFLWAPAIDRFELPLFRYLGPRRGWLLAAQAVLLAALLAMAAVTPAGHLGIFVLIVLGAAFAGATQDVVVDAYRIEIAPPSVQGALAATYMLGYRLALLASGALALFLADLVDWPTVYRLMALLLGCVMVTTLLAREPVVERVPVGGFRATLNAGVVGPFREFFARFPGLGGAAVLLFIGLLKIPDQLLGVMAMPFYLDSGFSKSEIAAVSKVFGVWMGIGGAFLGGAAVIRVGLSTTLLVAAMLGAASNLLYLLLALHPGDLLTFTLVIAGDNAAGGFLGAAAVAWLSALVSRQYTATQYALFSSLIALPGKLLGGASGYLVAGVGYPAFFLLTALAVVPALLLWRLIRDRVRVPDDEPVGAAASSIDDPR